MAIFVFDAYGTLFNVHAAIARFRAEAGPDADRMSEVWRAKQLEYSWTLTLAGHYADFWTLTERALDYCAGALSVRRQGAAAEIARGLFQARRLSRRARGAARAQDQRATRPASCRTARPTCSKARSTRAGVGGDLDAVLSVDALKMFKPRPEVYGLVTDHYKCKPADVTFVSSNRWDVMASVSVGFRGLWVNRGKMPDEYFDFPPRQELVDLNELAALA